MKRKQFNEILSKMEIQGVTVFRLEKVEVELSKAGFLQNRKFDAADIAVIITGVVGSDTIPGAVEAVQNYGGLETKAESICGLTIPDNVWMYGNAISRIINSPEAARMVKKIVLSRSHRKAVIVWENDNGNVVETVFYPKGWETDSKVTEEPFLTITASLDGCILYDIAEILHDEKQPDYAEWTTYIKD